MDQQERFDIVVIGAGPCGLLLSVWLARWGYKIKHIDNRAEPTKRGRADGLQPRTMELLENMGLQRAIMARNPALVYEVAFWDPGPNGIVRTGTHPSCPSFIDARYPFTALLHQGHFEEVFIQDMKSNGVEVDRPWKITGFKNDGKDPKYPIEVNLARNDAEMGSQTVRTKYLFSGEGARSFVREQLGVKIQYKDPIANVWGVMDGVIKTNFPDIKMKCTIHSDAGSIMVIPRENNMVRLYIQIATSTDKGFDPRKTATAKEVQDKAKAILKPYEIEWETVDWYSVYPIGQGISERYTLDERVLMGGDVCHTHSPKAGQGMNTAYLDATNLAWKIHHVESGFADRKILKTYEAERRHIAEALLDFDAKYARLFSTKHDAMKSGDSSAGDENPFVKTFKENCEFTSGYGSLYKPNVFNWSQQHPAQSSIFLSTGKGTTLKTGCILNRATLTRASDANVVNLEQEIPANGAFRILIFAGKVPKDKTQSRTLVSFAEHTLATGSYLTSYLRPDMERVSHHERHLPHSKFFSFCTIFASKRPDIEIDDHLPPFLARYRDHVYADDIWDQRVPDAKAVAHAKMGLDENRGGVVVVRPDGYVGCVLRLVEGSATVDGLNQYFNSFTSKQLGAGNAEVQAQAQL